MQTKAFAFLLFPPLFALANGGCGSYPHPFEPPEKRQPVTLKVISWNTWHGLGQGFWKREELEPEERRAARFQEQIRLLKAESPDILFLQELNPVGSRSEEIAGALGMTAVFQRTNCGMSLFGARLPANLDMGVAILTKPPLKMQKIIGHKLSGPAGFCGPGFSFQYDEFRFALFALAFHPKYGSFLLAGAHLHHGAEWSAAVRAQIGAWEKTGVLSLSQKEELTREIDRSNIRRGQELDNLFSKASEIQAHYEGLPMILAGDFNASPESPAYKKITETHLLKDTAGGPSPAPYTWDPGQNQKNHKYAEGYGISVPAFDKAEVEKFFKNYDKRPRRIDYIFVSREIEVQSYALFASQPNSAGLTASDHFGVLASLGLQNGQKGSAGSAGPPSSEPPAE